MSSEWWLNKLGDELDQGDVLVNVPFLAPRAPTTYIKPKTLKNNVPGWEETAKATLHPREQRSCVTAYEVLSHGVMLSHGCEIDKPKNEGRSTENQRLLVVAVRPIGSLPEDQRDDVRNQARLSMMMLPNVPGVGDAYADLRLICPLPRPVIDKCDRLASMTPAAKIRLHAQITAFLFRTAPNG